MNIFHYIVLSGKVFRIKSETHDQVRATNLMPYLKSNTCALKRGTNFSKPAWIKIDLGSIQNDPRWGVILCVT